MSKNRPEKSDKLYRYADLSVYPFKKRVAVRAAAWVFYWLIKSIGKTVRFERHGWEHHEAIVAAGRPPVYTSWHDRIFLGTYFLIGRNAVALASQSFDGEYIARFMQRLGFGMARGSSTRGGVKGLVELIRAAEQGHAIALTIDGPKGPRHVAKEGATMLAKKVGVPVLPFIIEPVSYWTLNSWDRMQVPKPFTRAVIIFREPIYVPADAGAAQMEEKLRELQTVLEELTEEGKKWRSARK